MGPAHSHRPAPEHPPPCLEGPGELRALSRALDWAATPLGPSDDWPEPLSLAVQLLFEQASPALLCWGPELVTLYNDAAGALLGERHPALLGRSARDAAEPGAAALLAAVLGGETVTRRGRPFDARLDERGAFVSTWRPLRARDGAVSGVLATAAEAASPWLAEGQLRAALRAAKMFEWTFDAEQGRLRYSANHDEVLGFAAGGRPARLDDAESGWVHRGERLRFAEGLARTLRGGGDLHLEYRLRHPETGEVVWIETHATRLPGAAPALVAGIAQNVTARKRVERVLRDSEARQSLLLELGDCLAAASDPAEIQGAAAEIIGGWVGADHAMYCEYDAETSELTLRKSWAREGDPFPARVYAASGQPEIIGLLQAGREYSATDLQLEAPSSRGLPPELPSVRGVLVAPVTRRGRLVACFCVLSATPRRFEPSDAALLREAAERTWLAVQRARAELELRSSEERLRAALVAGKMAHWRWDPVSDRVHAADTLSELFGLQGVRAVLLEAQLFALLHPDDLPEHQRAVWAAVQAGSGWHREYRVIRPRDGATVWLEENARALREPGGGRQEFVGLVWDVTERKHAEAALRGSEARARLLLEEARASKLAAETANRAKDDFLATLSHELRTPLAAILLWAGVARSGTMAGANLGRALEAIVQSAESQSRLIEDLLDLSRLRSGKLSLAPEATDVAAVIDAALEIVRPLAVSKNIAVAVEVPRELGHAMFDLARLKQVLWNLLSNATKFTPAGGHVSLRARRAGGWLEVEVGDDGEGIAPEFLPHVFERFRQADMGETRPHGGLGIGLALSRELIELQGGTIEAESEGRGRGACFRVRLPWLEADALAEGAPVASAPPPGEALLGVEVLLIEDDVSTREAKALTLEVAGASVVVAASGEEGLAHLEAEPHGPGRVGRRPDVLVCDLGLPGMSGLELIRRVVDRCRSRGERVPPACAVSAHARDVDRARAVEAGFDLYVSKPICSERLVEAVEDLRDIARGQDA